MNQTLEKQFAKYKANFIRNMERAGVIVEGEMINIVAQKTRKLEKSIKADRAKVSGSTVEVEIGGEGVHYAIYVEKGVKGRIYNYHRLSGSAGGERKVVWVGVGMQWAERALINKAEEITSIIRSTRI